MDSRRPPGTLPPKLTPEQQAYAVEGYPVAMRLARRYGARNSVGYAEADLLSIAHEALTEGARTFDPSLNKEFEEFIWIRIRGEIKDALRKRARELGLRPEGHDNTPPPGLVDAAVRALDDYASTLADPGDLFKDTPEDSVRQFAGMRDDAAMALAVGASGLLWYMRGEEGLILREEYTRARQYLHENISTLPQEYAEILDLRFLQQFKIDTVAEKMGMSKATAERRIADAIKLIRSRLSARGIREAPSLEGR